MAVSESERKIDKLKKDNEELRGRLHELQIDTTDTSEQSAAGQMMDEEIIDMNRELGNIQKDYGLLQEKFKKINIINDQVSGWAKRVFQKFGSLVDPSLVPKGHIEDIVKVFEGMNMIACDELRKLIERKQHQEEGDKGIEYGDVFTDFNTEEFISKNVRVRPVSGVTHADETKDGRQSSVSKGNQVEPNEDGEDNYNKFAVLELEDQRKAIKIKHREALEEIRKKQLALQKEIEAKKAKM